MGKRYGGVEMSNTPNIVLVMVMIIATQTVIIGVCLDRILALLPKNPKEPVRIVEPEKYGGFSKELQQDMIELDKLGKKMLDKLKKQRERSK